MQEAWKQTLEENVANPRSQLILRTNFRRAGIFEFPAAVRNEFKGIWAKSE